MSPSNNEESGRKNKWRGRVFLGNIPIGADCVAATIVDVAVVVADGTVVVPVDPFFVDADGCDAPATDK